MTEPTPRRLRDLSAVSDLLRNQTGPLHFMAVSSRWSSAVARYPNWLINSTTMPTGKKECPCHNCRGRLRDARTIKKHREKMEQQQISQPRLGNSQIPNGLGNGMPTTLPPAPSARYTISLHQPEQSSSMFSHVGTVSIHGGNFLQQNTQTISSLSGPGAILEQKFDRPVIEHVFQD